MQAEVSKVQVTESQARVPPEKPRSVQLKLLRLPPSHCSPVSMAPLPHIALPVVEVVVLESVESVVASLVVASLVVASLAVALVESSDPLSLPISSGMLVSELVPSDSPLDDWVTKASLPSSGSPQAERPRARGTKRAKVHERMMG